jgi:hypothetical protein
MVLKGLILTSAAVALGAGCSSSAATSSAERGTTSNQTTTAGTTLPYIPAPKEPKKRPKPRTGAAKWSAAVVLPYTTSKRDIYEEANRLCGAFSSVKVGQDYGAANSTPGAAAFAYSRSYQRPFRPAAYDGCLDGFKR